jgi:hypothetical protein
MSSPLAPLTISRQRQYSHSPQLQDRLALVLRPHVERRLLLAEPGASAGSVPAVFQKWVDEAVERVVMSG